MADKVRELFEYDAELSYRFNHMLDDKWDGMMDQPHIGYTYWNDPSANTMPNITYIQNSNVSSSALPFGVALQTGEYSINGSELTTRPMDPFMPPEDYRWIEVYMTGNGSAAFTVATNASYMHVSQRRGSLSSPGSVDESDIRLNITVDWKRAPMGTSYATLVIGASSGNAAYHVRIPLHNTRLPDGLPGNTFVESNGVVSMEAAHFSDSTKSDSTEYAVIPAYGRTLSGVTLNPSDCPPQHLPTAGYLTYDFYTFETAPKVNVTVYIGPSMNIDKENPIRWAMAVDETKPKVVTPLWDYVLSPPSPVSQNAIAGIWSNWTILPDELSAGQHKLKMWSLDPGLVLEKIQIDLGGAQRSFLGAPESYRT
jgi:hypothetical protein